MSIYRVDTKGGPGSGNYGHAGRPGKVGGSEPSGGGAEHTAPPDTSGLSDAERADENVVKWHSILAHNAHGPHHDTAKERLSGYLASIAIGRNAGETVEDYIDRSGKRTFMDWARRHVGKDAKPDAGVEHTAAPPTSAHEATHGPIRNEPELTAVGVDSFSADAYERAMSFETPEGVALLAKAKMTREQVYERINEARAQALATPPSKASHVQADGTYTPARQALHDKIVAEILTHGKTPAAGERPSFLMTGGYPGAGKSTMMKSDAYKGWQDAYVHIDSDEVKATLAKVDGIDQLTYQAGAYQAEADDVLKTAFQQVKQSGKNLLYDATMKGLASTAPIVQGFADSGYRTEIAYADLPLDKTILRGVSRFLEGGRFVDPAYIATHDHKNRAVLDVLKGTVDAWKDWSTDVPFGTPAKLQGQGTRGEGAKAKATSDAPAEGERVWWVVDDDQEETSQLAIIAAMREIWPDFGKGADQAGPDADAPKVASRKIATALKSRRLLDSKIGRRWLAMERVIPEAHLRGVKVLVDESAEIPTYEPGTKTLRFDPLRTSEAAFAMAVGRHVYPGNPQEGTKDLSRSGTTASEFAAVYAAAIGARRMGDPYAWLRAGEKNRQLAIAVERDLFGGLVLGRRALVDYTAIGNGTDMPDGLFVTLAECAAVEVEPWVGSAGALDVKAVADDAERFLSATPHVQALMHFVRALEMSERTPYAVATGQRGGARDNFDELTARYFGAKGDKSGEAGVRAVAEPAVADAYLGALQVVLAHMGEQPVLDPGDGEVVA